MSRAKYTLAFLVMAIGFALLAHGGEAQCDTFFSAIQEGNFEQVFRLSTISSPSYGTCKNNLEQGPLHIFALHNSNEDIYGALLFNAKADPNARDREGKTPLMYAALHNNETAALKLMSTMNPPILLDMQDNDGNTALHHAISRRAIGIMDKLMEFRADQEILNKADMSPKSLARTLFPRRRTVKRIPEHHRPKSRRFSIN